MIQQARVGVDLHLHTQTHTITPASRQSYYGKGAVRVYQIGHAVVA